MLLQYPCFKRKIVFFIFIHLGSSVSRVKPFKMNYELFFKEQSQLFDSSCCLNVDGYILDIVTFKMFICNLNFYGWLYNEMLNPAFIKIMQLEIF